MKKLLFLCLLCVHSVWADIEDVRIWPEPNSRTRVVLDLTGPHEYQAFYLSSPERVVLDISQAKMLKAAADIDLMNGPIKAIRSARRNGADTRVVLELKQAMDYKTHTLGPNEVHGYRLVVDMTAKPGKTVLSAKSPAAVVKKAEDYTKNARDILIAIDAGHGGEDPGAIGPRGIKEKNVVLAIAKELHRLVQQAPGFSSVLVRSGDYYVGLRERARKAEDSKADLFISIHADAFKHPSAYGSSVYMLSEHGASSTEARWLADKENRSDTIGGIDLSNKDEQLQHVIFDLSMTHKRRESPMLGEEILTNMGKISRLHKRNVEQAGFAVLKGASATALLIETGFISNPKEATQLANPAYQQKMAKAIFTGIKAYYIKHPPDDSLLAQRSNKIATYRVQRGDTLSQVARNYGVNMQEIRRINNLKTDTLAVGQTLQIPN